MLCQTDTLIVGAGPYGLSLAAHLGAAGVDFVIIGRPMDAWVNHMPEGMLLKSDGFASNLYDPEDSFTLSAFCRERGISYHDRQVPVALKTFVDYGLSFARRYAPELKNALVVSLRRTAGGFAAATDDGDTVIARRVVLAPGVGTFRYTPSLLSGHDKALVSHSYDHHALSGFNGRRVAVIGAGASAIDLAGLLADHGCEAHLICRADRLKFGGKPGTHRRTLWRRLRHPDSGLGPGWRSRLSTDLPLLFHALPASMRLPIVRRHLGPAAGWPMKEKVERRVEVMTGHRLLGALAYGDRVRLFLDSPEGKALSPTFDHVVAATGYRVDVRRLSFIDEALRNEIACVALTPVLSGRFESSVKGLYFIGPAAANSFGPMLRFAFGAGFASGRVEGALRARARARVAPAAQDAPANFAG